MPLLTEVKSNTMSKSEEDWQAEDDAHTIARAEEVKADPERLKRAQKAAKRIVEQEKARAKAMEKLAKAKLEYPNSPKSPKE
jgi:hypothetical protein